ncbi:MAG TPA: hypothetical protein GX499_05700 [Clostridiales bacterium]|nr:hypothetical protein [Clostridiales bacterium]
MKRSATSVLLAILMVFLLLPLEGCGKVPLPFETEKEAESSILEEFSPPAAEGQALEEAAVFPIELQSQNENIATVNIAGLTEDVAWRLQTMNWLDADRVVAVVADGRQSTTGSVIMAKALLFDWKAGQESFIITLPDVTINRVEQANDNLYFYDATTIYTVSARDYSFIDTAPNSSGSVFLGNLQLRRDDSGVVLKDLTVEGSSKRVARNDETGIYGSQMLWSPDGQRYLITRQDLNDQTANGFLVGSREGEFLFEVDIAPTVSLDEEDAAFRYDFTPYWSADGRSILIADSSSLRSYSAYTGEMLYLLRSPLYNSVNSIRDFYGRQVLLCKPAGKSWNTFLLDLATGESTDLLETAQSVAAKISPDGSRMVAVENESASRMYVINL